MPSTPSNFCLKAWKTLGVGWKKLILFPYWSLILWFSLAKTPSPAFYLVPLGLSFWAVNKSNTPIHSSLGLTTSHHPSSISYQTQTTRL
jgi:hypothetical protein